MRSALGLLATAVAAAENAQRVAVEDARQGAVEHAVQHVVAAIVTEDIADPDADTRGDHDTARLVVVQDAEAAEQAAGRCLAGAGDCEDGCDGDDAGLVHALSPSVVYLTGTQSKVI